MAKQYGCKSGLQITKPADLGNNARKHCHSYHSRSTSVFNSIRLRILSQFNRMNEIQFPKKSFR